MTTCVLVHGAWHGGRCWDRLVPALAARGHDAVVMDLPAEDGTATLDDYATVVEAAAAHVTDDVVVVGRSLGAPTAPVVASRRPTKALVLPIPGDQSPFSRRPAGLADLLTSLAP